MLLINFFKKASGCYSVINGRMLMLFLYTHFTIRFTTLFLFLLCSQLLCAQNIDSLFLESKSANNSKTIRPVLEDFLKNKASNKESLERGIALYALGNTFKLESSYKALEYYKVATPFLEEFDNELLKDIYFERAEIHTLFSEFPEALTLALKSLEYNQLHSKEENIQRDMSQIGYIHDRMYEYKESIQWNRKALEIAKKLNDKKGSVILIYFIKN